MPAFGMNWFNVTTRVLLLSISAVISLDAGAAEDFGNLQLFKGHNAMQNGQWRMEMLSTNDPSAQQTLGKMGKMSICVDMAKQLAKNSDAEKPDCTAKILRNTADVAEIESSCTSGTKSHVTLTRESKDSYLIDGNLTSEKNSQARTFKARYTYEGECKGDSMIKMDKQSEACQKMKAQMQGADLSAMCASTPEQHRAQCEQRMKQMQAMCQ